MVDLSTANTVPIHLEVTHETVLADGNTCWVLGHLATGEQRATVIAGKVDYVDCLRYCATGLILEFGVAGGKSIREIARHTDKTVYGFDWWKGLPHDWEEGDLRGSFACVKPGVGGGVDGRGDPMPDNVTLIDGLFSDTLEPFLESHPGDVGLVHIDCDLYCSCLYVLECLADRLVKDSVIMFDEIVQGELHGERRAFYRFLQRNPAQRWEFIGKQHPWGEVWQRG